jgi:hypothetical protein
MAAGNLKEGLLATQSNLRSRLEDPWSFRGLRTIQVALVIAIVVSNAIALCLNLAVLVPLESQCNVYVVGKRTTVFRTSSDFNTKSLKNLVAAGSVTKWINPSWRIPAVDIVDARGTETYVQGDPVTSLKDDQYNIVHSKATTAMVDKLKGIDASSLQFPVDMNWIQIEGADSAFVLKVHLGFIVLVLILLGVFVPLPMMLKKGFEFFAMYIAIGGFTGLWFGNTIGSVAQALSHPPTSAMIQEIPESFRQTVVQPCNAPSYASDCMFALQCDLMVQATFLMLLGPIGKMMAERYIEEKPKTKAALA